MPTPAPTESRRLARPHPLAALCLLAGLSFGVGVLPAGARAQDAARFAPEASDVLKADAEVYRQHIFTLANPWFEGRCPGDRGNADASDYLEFHMRRVGLTPAFPEGERAFTSFHQYFVPGRLRGGKIEAKKQSLTLKSGSGQSMPKAEVEMRALALSGSGKAEGSVVFVGYAIAEGNEGYKSFQGSTDLKGRIAMLLRFEPMKGDGTSKWAESRWSPKSDLPTKVTECFTRGASAVIVVNPPGAKDDRVGRLMNFTEAAGNGRQQAAGPVVMLGDEAAAAFVQSADPKGRSLADLRTLADSSGDMIDLAKGSATVEVEIVKEEIRTSNVGGVIKGKGALADQWVVIGAHYDHVGYGDFGSMSGARGVIHPGADDNGSGTSGMLLAAKKLSEYYAKLPDGASCRSILLMGFSGEESGLEGSRHYTRNLIAPKDKHYLMINMDMIGRLRDDPALEVSGLGTAPGLAEWLDPYWKQAGFPIKPLTKTSAFDGRSDHASFHQVKIPAIFFFTGLHDDYHRPADTADKINVDGAVKIVDLAYRIAVDASTRPDPLVFGEAKKEEPKTEETKPAADATPARVGMGRVRFGIMPGDYNDETPGVLVGEVRPGTPADKGGLKKDDRITKWNGKELKDVEAFTAEMREAKPGDKVKITYLREGKEHETELTLDERQPAPEAK